MNASLDEARAELKRAFGYDDFRKGQAPLVEALLAGRDCLGVMPTGAGKSICYQVPSLLLDGVTVVVSPLVSLMEDQVSALVDAGVKAACVSSQLSASEQGRVLARAANGAYDLLYVAPERLEDPRFADFAQRATIALVAVDEAHCVSQWGQDFRPSYLKIGAFIASLPARPIVGAFTATATERVRADIVRLLELRDPVQVTTGFDRPNLRFSVEELSDKRKLARIMAYVTSRPDDSGIIYCATRKHTEKVCAALVDARIKAVRYHAGLSTEERAANQRAFVNDDAPVMVATNAFGMGIDKSNVRYVIHFDMPGSVEAYYQEAGRAGRDGEPSECLLLWNDGDLQTQRFFINQDSENQELTAEEVERVRTSQRQRLERMVGYCTTCDCLRGYLLRYFGEDVDAQAKCGACGNCDGGFEAVDVTKTARSVMRCVHELRGRYGKGIVAGVLTGSKSKEILERGLDQSRTYGDAADASVAEVRRVVELLAADGYLEISDGQYPVVGLGPRCREAAVDGFALKMKRTKKVAEGRRAHMGTFGSGRAVADLDDPAQQDLFERLRALRKRLASEAGIAPYMVFSDRTLREMCLARPRTDEELLAISGVGVKKLRTYGEDFLAEIAAGE